jgi:hydrogenase maturation protease
MTRERPLVVGIGNEHRGDDAAGLLAVRELRILLAGLDGADVVEHRGDGASLLDLWSGRSHVILVDALHDGGPAGRVVRHDAADRPLRVETERGSTHAFGPAGAIEMARRLGRLPARIEVYGITGDRFGMGDEARTAVVRAALAVARSIAAQLAPAG